VLNNDAQKIAWKFDNSYARLSEVFYKRVNPIPVEKPQIVVMNNSLANDLGLILNQYSENALAANFSGNVLPDGAEPLAQAYAGHQFGHFTILGDGRAHLIGEHINSEGKRVDIQFKGSGQTPYARSGDGRAAIGPMLREYIISEAMHSLNIPTTRSLAVVTTGELVYRQSVLQGAILTRVSSSHIRVGTFEYVASKNDIKALKQLADYTIDRHYPELKESDKPYLDLVSAVMKRQISLIVDWLRVGFIHGVMNTDNMTISGETIDYGPCAFMDVYNPKTVFSSIDQIGRYAYANQPHIAQWNLARFAESLLPLLHEDVEQAAVLAEEVIQSYNNLFQQEWLVMMRSKLGLFNKEKEDEQIISELLQWMQRHHMDYTNTFRALISKNVPDGKDFKTKEFQSWWQLWQSRLKKNKEPLKSSFNLMKVTNPDIIPRNHIVEKALSMAEEEGDFSNLHKLLEAISTPYDDASNFAEFREPPEPKERVYQTFCGT